MAQGYLMLENGSSATCSYVLTALDEGTIQLPPTFFTPHGETTDDATLQLEDGTRKRVRVTFGPNVGEASFAVLAAA